MDDGLSLTTLKVFPAVIFRLSSMVYRPSSEYSVDEGCERGALGEDEERAQEQEHDDDGQQPEFFVLPQEQPDFAGERELAHVSDFLRNSNRKFHLLNRARRFSFSKFDPKLLLKKLAP
jgi:hypothetical protein